jgi:hypothetical protein
MPAPNNMKLEPVPLWAILFGAVFVLVLVCSTLHILAPAIRVHDRQVVVILGFPAVYAVLAAAFLIWGLDELRRSLKWHCSFRHAVASVSLQVGYVIFFTTATVLSIGWTPPLAR